MSAIEESCCCVVCDASCVGACIEFCFWVPFGTYMLGAGQQSGNQSTVSSFPIIQN